MTAPMKYATKSTSVVSCPNWSLLYCAPVFTSKATAGLLMRESLNAPNAASEVRVTVAI